MLTVTELPFLHYLSTVNCGGPVFTSYAPWAGNLAQLRGTNKTEAYAW